MTEDEVMRSCDKGLEQGTPSNTQKKECWTCDACGALNKKMRTRCHACNKEDPAAQSRLGRGIHGMDWVCSNCSVINFARRLKCFGCGVARVMDESPLTRTVHRDEWICGVCSSINFKDHWDCYVCRASRSYGQTLQEAGISSQVRRNKGDVHMADMNPGPSTPQAEDWACRYCGELNKPGQTKCLNCQQPPPKPRSRGSRLDFTVTLNLNDCPVDAELTLMKHFKQFEALNSGNPVVTHFQWNFQKAEMEPDCQVTFVRADICAKACQQPLPEVGGHKPYFVAKGTLLPIPGDKDKKRPADSLESEKVITAAPQEVPNGKLAMKKEHKVPLIASKGLHDEPATKKKKRKKSL
jgi:hypothetical protein